MAEKEQLKIILQGADAWNKWRVENPEVRPNLSGANLNGKSLSNANLNGAFLWDAKLNGAFLWDAKLTDADLHGADLRGAKLQGADLCGTYLIKADLTGASLNQARLRKANLDWAKLGRAFLSGADLHEATLLEANLSGATLSWAYLRKANLSGADLSEVNLRGANLSEANLSGANLSWANLSGADLCGASLSGARLIGTQFIRTDICHADLTGSSVYGISVWDIKVNDQTKQQNLVITGYGQAVITVDNIKVAQFIYLLLDNKEIRDVINTIGQKGVLILGRFTEERKKVLDGIRNRLRQLGFVPMMFDFERPTQLDFTETIKVLAGLSRFIIADITNPASSPLELQAIMPDYMIPFVPIIQQGEKPFSMFQDLNQKYGEWVLKVLEYDSADNLIKVLGDAVVRPALEMSQRLILKKAEVIQTRHVKDYMAGGPV